MKIDTIRAITGPNVFSHNPVLVMRLDLENLAGKESYEVAGFIDRLLAALPGVRDHHCAKGRPGGFVERLYEGTYFGHIVEHVCLELTDRAGISVNRGKTVLAVPDRVYDVAVEYKSEPGMRRLLEIAVEYVQALADDRPYRADDGIAQAIELVHGDELGPSTKAIVDAAAERGIPWVRLSEDSLIQFGHGIHRRFLQAAMSSNTSAIAVDIASDKELTKSLLARASIPVPAGRVVESAEEAMEAFEQIGGAVAIKPLDGNQGKGVSVHVDAREQVSEAFDTAAQFSKKIIVEEMFQGRDYRLLVLNGKFVAASERIPAQVKADGLHSIRELIEIANTDPRRGEGHSKPLSAVRVDPVVISCLRKQGIDLETVPADSKTINLRENANLSTGGLATDVTDRVHESIKLIAERAARAIGLDICGVDLVVPDIAQPLSTGGIVELNAAPGLRMHEFPTSGIPRRVGAEVVRMLYPSGNGRIPIVSITGTNGKTTTTRLIAHVVAGSVSHVGMTTTEGIWIDGRQVAHGDMTGPRSAATVLSDPEVEIAILETARGGIVRNGLGYDWSDIGVMTNIHPDHIGQDGIEDENDILRIKSLVAERVREGGVLVLNADDPLLAGVPERPKVKRVAKRIVWFTFDTSNPVVQKACSAGETVYALENGVIREIAGSRRLHIVDATALPFTFGGTARFQIANLMAAVAACRALGASVSQIRARLRTFDPGRHNSGRANLYSIRDGYFLFDYGHNTRAIEAIAETAAAWRANPRTCVLGLPGDRADRMIEQAARSVARAFQRVVLREDRDLRGRKPGEVAEMIAAVIRRENPDVQIEIVSDELEATRLAINRIESGELVVALCDDCAGVRQILERCGATPASSFTRRRAERKFVA